MPASGVAVTNTNPYAVNTYIYGGSGVTTVRVNGTQAMNQASGVLTGWNVFLNPGDTIAILYSGATPNWQWFASGP